MLTREQMLKAYELDCFAMAYKVSDGYVVQCRALSVEGVCLASFNNFDALWQWATE